MAKRMSTVKALQQRAREYRLRVTVEHFECCYGEHSWVLNDGCKVVEVSSYSEGLDALRTWTKNHPLTGRYSIIVTVSAVNMADAGRPIDLFEGPEVITATQIVLQGGRDQAALRGIVEKMEWGAQNAYFRLYPHADPPLSR